MGIVASKNEELLGVTDLMFQQPHNTATAARSSATQVRP